MIPILTIAIPTFNRVRWLSLTLPAIIEQASGVPSGTIEVVVSDNCSTDDTWTFLQEIAARAPFVRLNRNEENIGGEANFHLLPKLATGRYIQMIGDDDLIKPGTLRLILDALQDEPDYLIMNFDIYDGVLENCKQANRLNVWEDEVFRNQYDCLKRIDAMAMSFISMWVGRREFFNTIPDEKYRYFANWGMSVQADRFVGISRFPKGKLISVPCLNTRENSDFNEELFFPWFIHGGAEVLRYAEESRVLSKKYARTLKARLLRRHALGRIRYQRLKGIFKRAETYRILRADYGELWVFWLLCVPTMFTPGLSKMIGLARLLLGRADS